MPARTTRLLKVQCGTCAYTARVTRKWLAEIGAPLCPCNREPMEIADRYADELADLERAATLEMEAWEAEAFQSDYRVLREGWHTARARHRCNRCPGEIAIGEEYHRLTFTHSGALETRLSCLACKCRMTPAATGRGAIGRA